MRHLGGIYIIYISESLKINVDSWHFEKLSFNLWYSVSWLASRNVILSNFHRILHLQFKFFFIIIVIIIYYYLLLLLFIVIIILYTYNLIFFIFHLFRNRYSTSATKKERQTRKNKKIYQWWKCKLSRTKADVVTCSTRW